MDRKLCEYTETHWTAYFTKVTYMLCEFYLNSLLKKKKILNKSREVKQNYSSPQTVKVV